MSKRKNTDYLYASGRIRALEKTLLNKERIDRMLDAKTLEDSVKVLGDCEYGDGQELPSARYEELLTQEHRKTFAIVRSLDPELVSVFQLQYDYLNVKILLKSEFLGREEGVFSPLGELQVARLKTSIHDRSFEVMSPIMRNASGYAIEEYGKTGDPQCIDLILDAACFEEMLFKAKNMRSPFVLEYVKREIDSANIKAYARIKRQGGNAELFRNVFFEGGTIGLPVFLAHFDDDTNTFAQALSYTDFGKVLEAAAPHISAGNLGNLEKILDDFKIGKLKKAKIVSFGVETIVAYMAAKESDIKTARIILAGKAADIKSEQIAERVRGTYV